MNGVPSLATMLLLCLSGCAATESGPTVVTPHRTGATFSGPIVAAEQSPGVRLLVQAQPPMAQLSGRVWLGVPPTAAVYAEGRRATSAALRVGARIRAWVSTPILPSDPGQALVDSIVVDVPAL